MRSGGESMDPEVAEFLKAVNARPEIDLQSLPLEQALQLMRGSSLTTATGTSPGIEIQPMTIQGPNGPIPIRLYVPDRAGACPVIVNIHGGGFVSGSLNMDNHRCTMLAGQLQAVVVSVDYRLAPEHRFPAALEDCHAALSWAVSGKGGKGFDVTRVAVLGSSSGGNLAACAALLSRDRGGPSIVAQVLIYPVCDDDFDRDSYLSYRSGYFLTRDHMRWYIDQYKNPSTRLAPGYYMPLKAVNLQGLPPALVITAQFDPLLDEARLYAARLSEQGVRVVHRNYEDTIHGFLSACPNSRSSALALGECAEFLEAAFLERV